MKIKNLKDIGNSKRDCCGVEEEYINFCEECIKADAIKDLSNERIKHMSATDYILVKFDIKEEDLRKKTNNKKARKCKTCGRDFYILEEAAYNETEKNLCQNCVLNSKFKSKDKPQ